MVNNFVNKLIAEMVKAYCGIGIDLTATMNAIQNLVLQRLTLYVRDNLRANLAQLTVEDSEYYRLSQIGIAAHFLPRLCFRAFLRLRCIL